jgi:hypothetical protein
MDIHTAAHYLKSGYRIMRPGGLRGLKYDWIDSSTLYSVPFTMEELLATDWEIDFRDMIDDSGILVSYKEPPSDEEE